MTETSLLRMDDVHRAWLGEIADTEHEGYELVVWTYSIPADIPGAVIVLSGTVRCGQSTAGHAVIVAGPAPGNTARQYGPIVTSQHRGRGLGRWATAALIELLDKQFPHVREVEADIAATGMNLGFRPYRTVPVLQR